MQLLMSADQHGQWPVFNWLLTVARERHVDAIVLADTVFVSHSPAFGILDPGFAESQIGSRSLRQFLDTTPFLAHIHGHSHAGFGRHGKHFNVASAGRRRAMVLDTETMKHDVLDLEPRKVEGI